MTLSTGDVEIVITDLLVSKPYIDMTIKLMERFGVEVAGTDTCCSPRHRHAFFTRHQQAIFTLVSEAKWQPRTRRAISAKCISRHVRGTSLGSTVS
jgi:hypothetical protein